MLKLVSEAYCVVLLSHVARQVDDKRCLYSEEKFNLLYALKFKLRRIRSSAHRCSSDHNGKFIAEFFFC
jgi:hypothetical protein